MPFTMIPYRQDLPFPLSDKVSHIHVPPFTFCFSYD